MDSPCARAGTGGQAHPPEIPLHGPDAEELGNLKKNPPGTEAHRRVFLGPEVGSSSLDRILRRGHLVAERIGDGLVGDPALVDIQSGAQMLVFGDGLQPLVC